MPEVAIIGSTVHDLVLRPGRAPVEGPGGTPIFAVRALAAHGVTPGVATRCSDARLVTSFVALARPVCVQVDASQVRSELSYRPDGERDHALRGLGTPFSPQDVEGFAAPALRGAAWVQAGGQHAGDFPPATLAALRGDGRRVVLDAQGPLRAARLGPVRLSESLGADVCAELQAVKFAEEEALAGYGTLDPAEIAARIDVPEVLVTLGRTGARVAAGRDRGDVRAPAVGDVNPTGAGDAFLALYAHARAHGSAPVAAAQRACDGVSELLLAQRAAEAANRSRSESSSGRERSVFQS